MKTFIQFLEAQGLTVQIGAKSKDGTLVLYINGRRYVYWMDALYHKQIERLLDTFRNRSGKIVPPRPHQALELIRKMLADGAAQQIEPAPKPKPEPPDPEPPKYTQGRLF